MELVGYADRLSAAPGERIRFMVSCGHPSYRADLVRLIHGDEQPGGPGFKEQLVASDLTGAYPGRRQRISPGSYVVVPDDSALRPSGGFTIQAWIYPTLPERGVQAILAKWSPIEERGFALVVDERGALTLWVGDGRGPSARVTTASPLRARTWYFVVAAFDTATGEVVLHQEPVKRWPRDESCAVVTRPTGLRGLSVPGADLLIGACHRSLDGGEIRIGAHFNGKIDRPRIFSRALTGAEIASLRESRDPHSFGEALIAAWNFAAAVSTTTVTDASRHALAGRTVNMPARAMTGHNWTGNESNFAHAPDEYGGIHFHDDDLEDAGWDIDVDVRIPADLPSGVYAARLRAEKDEDYIPFVVEPPSDRAESDILFLIATNTYLAYANFNVTPGPRALFPNQDIGLHQSEHRYLTDNGLMSLYDKHRDGSGVCYSSRLRPILTMRPKFRFREQNCSRHLAAELYLVDWMDQKGFRADCLTDETLHHQGVDRLRRYRVIITSTHPEYWTRQMLEALEAYLARGGRLMYLGGNGFYWVTSIAPDRPHVMEVRRWGGTEAWAADPGECYHSTTGELGGLWRNRGRAPQRLTGVGFTAQGFDRAAAYVRQPGSFDPRAAFIFEGIGPDEDIGDFPALTLGYGAAGFEIDRAEPSLGTPPHALVLASSAGHSDSYQHVVEEVHQSDSTQGGSTNPKVRADLVFFEGPNGGAVFSVGSIAWCGALSHRGYENAVSRITENVLRRFVSREPFS